MRRLTVLLRRSKEAREPCSGRARALLGWVSQYTPLGPRRPKHSPAPIARSRRRTASFGGWPSRAGYTLRSPDTRMGCVSMPATPRTRSAWTRRRSAATSSGSSPGGGGPPPLLTLPAPPAAAAAPSAEDVCSSPRSIGAALATLLMVGSASSLLGRGARALPVRCPITVPAASSHPLRWLPRPDHSQVGKQNSGWRRLPVPGAATCSRYQAAAMNRGASRPRMSIAVDMPLPGSPRFAQDMPALDRYTPKKAYSPSSYSPLGLYGVERCASRGMQQGEARGHMGLSQGVGKEGTRHAHGGLWGNAQVG
jgi:hypothetical protein